LLLSATIILSCNSAKKTAEANAAKKAMLAKKAKADKLKKQQIQPYSKVVTKEAKTDDGLFKIHAIGDKYLYEIPDSLFNREMLMVTRIAKTASGLGFGGGKENTQVLRWQVKGKNPKVSFLFTVSPVRHIKDGLIENTQSKSHLLSAIHQVVEPRHQLYYFPSYEIMMDELRDYRFYNVDMLHPSDVAIDYIWERFKMVWLSEDALKTSGIVSSIQAKKSHRPFNPNSEAHHNFLAKLQLEIDELIAVFPHIIF